MKTSRRQFFHLSAAAGALLVPVLRGRAEAATARPTRLVFFHTPLGTIRESWLPTGSEAQFALSPVLEPLAAFKDKLLVIDGLRFDPQAAPSGASTGNHKEPGSMLTGRSCEGRDEASRHTNISIDQFLKQRLPGELSVKSLELMTFNRKPSALLADRNLFSASGSALPVVPEGDPQKAFDRVFGGFVAPTSGSAPAALEAVRLQRRSVLDVVGRELTSMRNRLNGSERVKLDQHLTSVRELEQRLQAPAPSGMCTLPGRPSAVDPYDNDTLPQRLRAHLDIIAVAMACDLARVAVLGNENGQGRASPRWLGYNSNWHDAYTHGSSGATQHTAIHTWYAEQFAYLVRRFSELQDGDGSLLDRSALVMFSEQGCRYLGSSPSEHSRVNLPYVVAGSCGGYFKTGRFVDVGGRSHKDFLFNCLRAMGHTDTAMGAVTGSPIAQLVAA